MYYKLSNMSEELISQLNDAAQQPLGKLDDIKKGEQWYIRNNSIYQLKCYIGDMTKFPDLQTKIANDILTIWPSAKFAFHGEHHFPNGFKVLRYDVGEGITLHQDKEAPINLPVAEHEEKDHFLFVGLLHAPDAGGEFCVNGDVVEMQHGEMIMIRCMDEHEVREVLAGHRTSLIVVASIVKPVD